MVIVQVCVGSSCHLKGSEEIVSLLRKEIEEKHLDGEVVLAGSFCTGHCNRVGVTLQVDDDVFTGVTKDTFREFFDKNVMGRINN
jgi:NADH:ubiquinone oxidoreductase subunit E